MHLLCASLLSHFIGEEGGLLRPREGEDWSQGTQPERARQDVDPDIPDPELGSEISDVRRDGDLVLFTSRGCYNVLPPMATTDDSGNLFSHSSRSQKSKQRCL